MTLLKSTISLVVLLLLSTMIIVSCSSHKKEPTVFETIQTNLAFYTPDLEMNNQNRIANTNINPFDPPLSGVPAGYRGFEGSYNYPAFNKKPPVKGYPWTRSLKGKPINAATAEQYVNLLKNHIKDDMIALLSDSRKVGSFPQWNAASRGWYNQPWLSPIRDGIHGAYLGSACMSPALFPKSGLTEPFSTYVLVFYNDIAAQSLYRVWGQGAVSPNFTNNAAIFDEGSIIVKAAFTTANADTWQPMQYALPWSIYVNPTNCNGASKVLHETAHAKKVGDLAGKDIETYIASSIDKPELIDVNLFQFDIVIKDSIASPETKWVFSTLVHDVGDLYTVPDAATAWKHMVPLGAMWGNDPQVININRALNETWINQQAPLYARETLGWGGRLSGPNDGAVQAPPYYQCSGDGCDPDTLCEGDSCTFVDKGGANLAMSSCMSCHSAAQYTMASFLLPVPLKEISEFGTPVPSMHAYANTSGEFQGKKYQYNKEAVVFYKDNTPQWMTWFQNRSGEVAKDQINPKVISSTDYNMNFPFKAMRYWAQEICIDRKNRVNSPVCKILPSTTYMNASH
ncbi:hypothetical protein [uncultured Shewanella sp.]|uniref:hypothetical protein n=1 Tax=uncultured Shewanella sp. TaxID=173975 RepID=UPI00261E0249|nr:hypothetical protein [uncultured Shewanella sp.]